MNAKKVILLVGALIVAAMSAMMARSMFAGASAPAAQAAPVVPAGPKVLVATRALPVGTIIDAESFRYQVWPEGLTQPAYFIEGQENSDPQSLIGSVVRSDITAGQPLTLGALIKPGERGFLAAALGPGMRAVTVSVSQISGVAGFIFPGDRVDLVLTQDVKGGGDGEALKASETILRNVRVLAINQQVNPTNAEGKAEARADISNVTLEATPQIAEKIAVAQTIGSLSLSLRSIADNTAELERAIAAGEIKMPEGADAKTERKMLLEIASRPSDRSPTYTTGADVSRFQRRSVPGRAREANAGTPTAGVPAGEVGASVPAGPAVRVARGNNITVVPVGGK